MNYQTIKIEGIGEVPIIGEVDSFTRGVRYYKEDEVIPILTPKQAPKPLVASQERYFKPTNQPIKVGNYNQPSLLFK